MYIINSVAQILKANAVDLSALIRCVDTLVDAGEVTKQGESYRLSGTKSPKLIATRSRSTRTDLLACDGNSGVNLLASTFAVWHTHIAHAETVGGETVFGHVLPMKLAALPRAFPYKAPAQAAPAEAPEAVPAK